jgi:hypothetical protein
MYYPYLRGKQFELILLRDNAEFIAKNDIHPIIEPVKTNFSSLKNTMKVLNEKGVSCTLIVCMSSNGFGQTCLELRDGFSTHIYLSCNFSKSPRPFLLPS